MERYLNSVLNISCRNYKQFRRHMQFNHPWYRYICDWHGLMEWNIADKGQDWFPQNMSNRDNLKINLLVHILIFGGRNRQIYPLLYIFYVGVISWFLNDIFRTGSPVPSMWIRVFFTSFVNLINSANLTIWATCLVVF